MKKQILEFVETKQTSTPVINPNSFQYCPTHGWAWLQRLCISFLRWRQCNTFGEKITITRHIIDSDNIIEQICKQKPALMQQYHQKAERLLIGADDFSELMKQPMLNQVFSFDAEYRYDGNIFGMKITVVPWMTGMVVLPKTFNKQKSCSDRSHTLLGAKH